MLDLRISIQTTQRLIARIRGNLAEAERVPVEKREQKLRLVALDAIVLANRVERLVEEIERELPIIPKKKRTQVARLAHKTVDVIRGELQTIQSQMICLAAA